MALSGDGLFQAVKTALGVVQDSTIQEAAFKPICEAIVAYIKANAVVTVQAGQTVATTGSAAAQSGSTTSPGAGTIS